jgi:hypothetical protein
MLHRSLRQLWSCRAESSSSIRATSCARRLSAGNPAPSARRSCGSSAHSARHTCSARRSRDSPSRRRASQVAVSITRRPSVPQCLLSISPSAESRPTRLLTVLGASRSPRAASATVSPGSSSTSWSSSDSTDRNGSALRLCRMARRSTLCTTLTAATSSAETSADAGAIGSCESRSFTELNVFWHLFAHQRPANGMGPREWLSGTAPYLALGRADRTVNSAVGGVRPPRPWSERRAPGPGSHRATPYGARRRVRGSQGSRLSAPARRGCTPCAPASGQRRIAAGQDDGKG